MTRRSSQKGVEIGSAEGWAQLVMLRDLTARTGVIHEAQRQQLLYWPYVAAPHLAGHTATYQHDKRLLRYDFAVLPGKRPPADFKHRLEALGRSVHALLGEDCQVVVRCAGRTIFSLGAKGDRASGNSRKRARRAPRRRR